MKKTMGSGLGAMAILAFTVHSAFTPAAEHGVAPAETPKQHRQKTATDANAAGHPALEGPWLATRGFFALSTPQPPAAIDDSLSRRLSVARALDRSSARNLLGVPQDYQVRTIVATVADPVHTHLPLFFDQQIEAIESAAERQDWEFARQWLPWAISRPVTDDSFDDRLAERQFERDQESLPGVLVFRHRGDREFLHKCLLVFLVPETPTAGIAAAPFNAAMNLALAVSDGNNVGLLAPTFSGSFESLTRLAQLWPAFTRLGRPVFSGTASSSERARMFFHATHLPFHGGVASIDADRQVFEKILLRHGISKKRAAYLIEGESGYANSFMQETGIVTYRYPRDIANLRNAYQEATTADPTKDASQNPIDFTMKDRSHGEDTVPIFSDTHTPVLESALLSSIAKDFRQNRIELVYIVATNNLDALFLARIIRRGSPGTRVLVGGGDLLFVPAASQESIAGTLFLSTYPVFLQGSKWISANDGHIHAFPSANFQGLFIVTQQLLHSMGSSEHVDQPGFEHFPTDEAKPFPGLWLLTLTRNGLAPLDWFENDLDGRPDQSGFCWFATLPNKKTASLFHLPDPSLGWYLTVFGLGLISLPGSFLILRANLADSAPIPFWLQLHKYSPASALTLWGACCSMSLLMALLSLPAWPYFWQGSAIAILAVVFSLLALAAPLSAAALAILHLPALLLSVRPRHKLIAAAIFTAYCLLASLWAFSCYGRAPQTDLLFRYRAIDLYSGASPAAPLLILCLVFLLRSGILFRRYSEVAWDSPRLVFHQHVKMHSYVQPHVLAVEEHLKSGISSLDARVKTPIEWRYATSGLLALVCLLPLWPSLRSFEQWPYNWSIQISVALVLLAIAIACQDLIHMWRNLRSMLLLLEMSPLRGAIGRVVRHWPRQAVWALWRSISRQRLAAQMLLALHNRHQAWPQSSKPLCDYVDFRDLSDVRFSAAGHKFGPETTSALHQYEHQCAILAAKILENELVPYWDETALDDNGEPRTSEKETPQETALKASADFVALQLCNYILFAVRHTQRLAWSVSLGLLLLILALTSYHPQSPQLLGRLVTLAFAGCGGVIGWVLAGMEKNWVLSRIGRTTPGRLNLEFWTRLASVVILPLSAVLVHLFPSLSGFLSNVLTPGMEALK